MQIHKVQDPRDNLERARRAELIKFAQDNKVAEIDPQMPATLIRRILRNKGLTQIAVSHRQLGQISQTRINTKARPDQRTNARARQTSEEIKTVDAEEDLARQWKTQQSAPSADETLAALRPQIEAEKAKLQPPMVEAPLAAKGKSPHMGKLRREAKQRGIAVPRTATAAQIKELLDG